MASQETALTTTNLPLKLVAQGKVRDVYDAGLKTGTHAGALLFVATDRISAFDVVLQNGIPQKGKLLHALSTFWFDLLTPSVIESHVLATRFTDFPQELQDTLANVRDQVEGRSMLVRRADVVPIEAIVRGYLTGSGWKEYTQKGTVHGITLSKGIVESQEIPNGPLFTPSTKAEQGAHDENIHPDKVAQIVGNEALANDIQTKAIALYKKAAEHAKQRGIILADTKFEFGLCPAKSNELEKQLILIDEVLTPDSSRFWSLDGYAEGRGQDSFDKQYVRDWLKSNGLDKAADTGVKVSLPQDVVQKTAQKYREAYERITGQTWQH